MSKTAGHTATPWELGIIRPRLMNGRFASMRLVGRGAVIICSRGWSQDSRMVEVTEKLDDVKGGRPGFVGREWLREGGLGPQYQSVWGYDYQIRRIIHRAEVNGGAQ